MNKKLMCFGILLACTWVQFCAQGSEAFVDKQSELSKPVEHQTPLIDVSQIQSIQLMPPKAQLTGPMSEQRFIVLARMKNGREQDVTSLVQWDTVNDDLVQLQGSVARPQKDGQGKVTARIGSLQSCSEIKVVQCRQPQPVNFVTEIIPTLNKLGCNQGACHGAQHGKGGFRLSLFGFDPVFDHEQIVKSAEGRRVVVADPERSILLQKPTLQMEHGGGERLKVHSAGYDRLQRWLAEGAPGPRSDVPSLTGLDVFPHQRVMHPGDQQQIVIQALWSDGRREDVTSWVQYDAMSEAQSTVNSSGIVLCKDRGESHIMIRYMGQATVFTVTSPYSIANSVQLPPAEHFVDQALQIKWQQLGLVPSPICSDEVYLRRVYLDLIGTLPTPDEILSFLADKDLHKRAKVVDHLLNRAEFIDFWALKWGDLLRNNRIYLEPKGMWSMHHWIRGAIRDEMPMDQFVRSIITAEGSTFREGPANFFRIGNTAADWAETTSQVFLGVRIQCAKCHHHPFEKWSQDDYYGMSAFFTRIGTKNSLEYGIFGRETIIFVRPNGEMSHPRGGGIVKPHPLDGPVMNDELDRRAKLADWIVEKHNPYFARNLANRFWAYLMGRGIIDPVDDLRATNPASIPELLDALAQDLVAHQYSLKHLLKTIVLSKAYQRKSDVISGNASDVENKYYTRYQIKRLTAEQLADAIDYVTGTIEKYPGLPLGTRAIQLPDSGVRSYLLDVFGRPARQLVCECERTMTPNIAQALQLMNGDLINSKISRADSRIDRLFKNKRELHGIVEELYLVSLGRPPKPAELEKAMALIKAAPSPRLGAEDLIWALLNSREFLFNH